MIIPDYNFMTPMVLEKILEVPIHKALGKKELNRISSIQANYDYYNGMQHYDEDLNAYVYPHEVDDWEGRAYKPTRFTINHFKSFIKRKSRWQMAGQHTLNVLPKSEKESDIEHAKKIESVLYDIWEDNEMDSQKMQIARERLIAGSIACKLSYNERTGKLHWIWHKATEVFPTYSQDGFNDLLECHIIRTIEDPDDSSKVNYVVQHFWLDDDQNECYLSEKIYDFNLEVKKVILEDKSLGFNFVPVIMFDVKTLATEPSYFEDIEDMKIITRTINDMMEDASDSLKFEMFAMTVVKNADLGEDVNLEIAPGALLKVNSDNTSLPADVSTVETSFNWKETYKDQYNRLKSALHELAGLPQVTPTELNFGGMNDRALQVLYQEIIQETQEHWLMWEKDFKTLFEYSIRYLQARSSTRNFDYDKTIVDSIEKFKSEMKFQLPLPDDRTDLVALLKEELELGLESRKHAMKRLGVKDPDSLMREIYDELQGDLDARSPYEESPTVEINREVEEDVGNVEFNEEESK